MKKLNEIISEVINRLVEKKEKRITIYDKDSAVKKFHELYLLTKDGYNSFD